MKSILGYTLIFGGIILGIYVGFWLLFVGGIIDLIHINFSDTLATKNIVISIMKIVFAGMVGVIIALIGIYLGVTLTERGRG